MPVDSHMLISLSAPRPLFITGGTTDQWSDPKGEFLGAVAAGPVYNCSERRIWESRTCRRSIRP